jgi:hypothetical protein
MEIKIIKLTVYINLFLFTMIGYSQPGNDKSKYIKQYAYCDCIFFNNNKFDISYLNNKFQISDKSSNRFISLSKISEEQSKLVRDFTEKMTGNFYSIESSYYSESGNSNTITAMCLEFYESKELDKFIKKLLKGQK